MAFVDFECPFCRDDYFVFKDMMEKYEPIVQIVFKNLPLESIHPNAMLAAQAGLCANEQGKFWQYHDNLFLNNNLSKQTIISYSDKLGLNDNNFIKCLESKKYNNQIVQDISDAVDLGLLGTPTYFVNGVKIEGSVSEDDWDKIILQFFNN